MTGVDLRKIELDPTAWIPSTLADHVEMISGVHIDSDSANDEGRGVPYLTGPADFKGDVAEASRYTEWPQVMCRAGDILVTVKGSGAGRAAIALEDACISRQLAAIRVQEAERSFWVTFIKSRFEELQASAGASLIPGLARGDLLSLQLHLPPVHERRAISDFLDSVNESIRCAERKLAKLNLIQSATTHRLLTEGVDENGRLREVTSRCAELNPAGLELMSPEWRMLSIKDFATVKRGASPRPIDDPAWFSDEGPGWVRIKDVTAAQGYLRKTAQKLAPAGVLRSVKVYPGQVIMSIAATIGEVAIVDMEACVHDGFVAIDPDPQVVTPEFLAMLLRCNRGEFLRYGQVGTQSNINSEIVGNFKLAIPPLGEQARITAIIDAGLNCVQIVRNEIEKLSKFKQGLTRDLLEGARGVVGSSG